jgi:hypothetical protein
MGIWQNFEVPNYILIRQTVSLIRKAVPHYYNYADRYNPITYVILLIRFWNVAGVFISPNCITNGLYSPSFDLKAAFYSSPSLILI